MKFHHVIITVVCATTFSAALFSSCKKKDNAAATTVSYKQLGDERVNLLSGFAMNGDVLGRAENGDVIRYRSASTIWERVGTMVGIVYPYFIVPACEDASGNFYGNVPGVGNYTTTGGTAAWVKMPSPDADTASLEAPALSVPYANATGELVMQTHTVKNGVHHVRVYRKAAGSAAWVMASERTLDYFQVMYLDDKGDAYFINASYPDQSPMVLKAGTNTLQQIADCAGTTILPYCGSKILVNASGGSLWYKGGIASHHLYKMPAATAYPSTATLLYDMPDNMCCFNGGQAYMPDGTLVARMNNGTYDYYHLFVRKAGAGSWFDAGLLPAEDGQHSVDIIANRKGDLYTWSIDLGQVKSVGLVYKVNY